ncbi:MAG: hypothetical protein CO094_14150 [Anaerolineae bacterium CG_4_9_14_3_um_filter_57_17]|nr:hypothetical protein [bacterium]NCT19670.1 hypothetical protein [bacterium]OIO85331.1 MAG: hypothetical protein AUK01_06305 [Anaerolineae bacterium CG2_30_57_67]PJB64054.1 MAG: hypothetical protein CO094_14150 [Anaerolineae bacterium CG_4_9_14_3_um_filter_57_17]
MNLWKMRYTQIFAALFWLGLVFVMLKSLNGGPENFDGGLYGRRKLILNYANLRLALGDQSFSNMLVGKDGWLFMTTEKTLEDFQGISRLKPEELSRISAQLWSLKARLDARGATLIVLIVPNKQTVYPDKLPDAIFPLSPVNRMTQFYDENAQNGPPVLMDIRPLLAQARLTRDVYLKTDTHWNVYGAYVTYQAILQRLKPDFPALEIYPEQDFTFSDGTPLLMDLTGNTGGNLWLEKPPVLATSFDPAVSYRVIKLSNGRELTFSWQNGSSSRLPRLLMFHDSFGFDLRYLLAAHFSKATFVPHFSGADAWNNNWIEQTDPDVVIIEFAERYVDSIQQLLAK